MSSSRDSTARIPRPRRPRRLARLSRATGWLAALAGAATLTLLAAGPAPAVVGHAGAGDPQVPAPTAGLRARMSPAAGEVQLTLTGLSPVTVTDQRPFVVSGRVRSDRLRTLRNASVSLELGTTPITARSAVDDVLADPGYTAPVAGAQVDLNALRPGTSRRFSLPVDTSTLPLGVTGVYPIRIVVDGTLGGVPQQVASVTTLLPWYSAVDQVARTRVLFLWPLVDVPHRDHAGVFLDDSLASELAPGGRLYRLVAAGADRPVAWMVDPALLAAASAMSGGYDVRTAAAGSPTPPATGSTPPTTSAGPGTSAEASPGSPSGTTSDGATSDGATSGGATTGPATVRGSGGAAARQWLEAFNLASSRAEVATVPYGDVDVTSTLDAAQPWLLRGASAWGASVAADILGRPVVHDVAWPVDGQADKAAVNRLGDAGQAAVILSGAQLPPSDVLAYTPSGRAQVGAGGDVPALLSDPVLDAQVATGAGADPLLARQRFLAETLLVTAELPTASRLLVIAPPRRWDPSRAYAEALVRGLTRAAWLRPVSLDTALAWPVPSITRAELPNQPPAGQLPPSYVQEAGDTNHRLRTFASILTQPDPVVPNYRAALYSSLSTSWRHHVPAGLQLLADTTDALDKQRAQVRIVSRGGTLTSTSGPFPVTVVNDLDQAVSVGLDVRSADPLRLRITAPDEVRVPAGARVSVNARVEATTSGDLAATAQLLTPQLQVAYSAPVELPVHVRAYGQVAVLVFGGAAALLMLAAGVRLVRRVRASRAGGGAA